MSKSVVFALSLLLMACSTVPHGTMEYFSGLNPETGKVGNLSFVTYDTPSFKKLLQKHSAIQLVDVRTPAEYEQGHVEGAILINVKETDFVVQALERLDVKQPVGVYCKGGIRSRQAARILSEKGFKVYNLDKGYDDWIKKK